MGNDYRSSLDTSNQANFGFKNTLAQLNNLTQARQNQQKMDQQSTQFNASQAQAKEMPGIEEQSKEKYDAFTTGQKASTQQANLAQAQDIVDQNSKGGRKVNAKIGDVDISQTDDNPLKYMFQASQKGNHALTHAYDTYAKGVPDLQKKFQASSEGLDAINDPSQIGAVGVVRSNMLRAMGMSRYNDAEASKSLPPSLYSQIKPLFSSVKGALEGWSGDPNAAKDNGDMNPMDPTQKAAASSFFRGNLQNLKGQHQMLKQTGMGSYQSSGYFDPDKAKQLQGSMGTELDAAIDKRLAPPPGTPPSNQQSPLAPPPQTPSMLDKLKGMFGAKPAQPQQSQPQQSQGQSGTIRVKHKASGQTGTIPSQEFDPNTYDQVN